MPNTTASTALPLARCAALRQQYIILPSPRVQVVLPPLYCPHDPQYSEGDLDEARRVVFFDRMQRGLEAVGCVKVAGDE